MPTLSVAETVEVDASMTTVTKTVLEVPIVALTLRVPVRAFVGLLPLFAVPIDAAVTAPGTVRTRAPEADETFVLESVAVAVMLCVPADRVPMLIPLAYCATVPDVFKPPST